MKKLIFILALSMGSMTAFAQEEVSEEAAEAAVEATEVVAQDDFSEIAARYSCCCEKLPYC